MIKSQLSQKKLTGRVAMVEMPTHPNMPVRCMKWGTFSCHEWVAMMITQVFLVSADWGVRMARNFPLEAMARHVSILC